ncbi:MAG: hypothetical protein ACYDAY_01945 [Candidatus Dormibacteria bacterium]
MGNGNTTDNGSNINQFTFSNPNSSIAAAGILRGYYLYTCSSNISQDTVYSNQNAPPYYSASEEGPYAPVVDTWYEQTQGFGFGTDPATDNTKSLCASSGFCQAAVSPPAGCLLGCTETVDGYYIWVNGDNYRAAGHPNATDYRWFPIQLQWGCLLVCV